MSVVYLSGVRNETTDGLATYFADKLPLGLLVQPLTRAYLENASMYSWIGIDNGCFSEVGRRRFSPTGYIEMIRDAMARHHDQVVFATAPDVVSDWPETLRRSRPFLPRIRETGCPAALVLQDGATPESVPWDEIDCVFVGGSTEWKLGCESREICDEASRRRLWVHMGRVNSLTRMLIAVAFGCDSVDGTYLRFTRPGEGEQDILFWLRTIEKRKRGAVLAFLQDQGIRGEQLEALFREMFPLGRIY